MRREGEDGGLKEREKNEAVERLFMCAAKE